MKYLYLLLLSILFMTNKTHAQTPLIETSITVSDGDAQQVLKFGIDPTATDNIDAALGELELPPAPPSGNFDARFTSVNSINIGEGLASDYRMGDGTQQTISVHQIKYQVGSGSQITVNWNLPNGVSGVLQDIITGSLINENMSGSGNYTVTNPAGFTSLKMTITYSKLFLAPSNLSAIAKTGKVDLSWNDNSDDETGFTIERKGGSSQTFAPITTVNAGQTTYSDNSINEGTDYTYRVKAIKQGQESGYSNEVLVKTLFNPVNAPTGLNSSINNNEILLTWNDNSNNETFFKIEREELSTRAYSVIDSVNANISTYTDKNVSEGKKYNYRVFAYNSNVSSGYSNIVTSTIPLIAPSNLVASATTVGEISLSWTDNSNAELKQYIERKLVSGSVYSIIDSVNPNIIAFVDKTVAEGIDYNYRVFVKNAVATSPFSNVVSIKSLFAPIIAPSNLAGVANQTGGVDLTWKDNSNNEEGFQIEREDPTTRAFVLLTSVGAGIEQYTDATTGEGKLYKYRVRGYNTNVNSPYSNEVSAITIMGAPSQLVAKTLNSSEIELSWLDNSESETGFKIEREKSSNVFDSIGVVGADTKLFVDKQLQENTSYVYRVIAFNQVTKTTYSNLDTALTKLNTPTALDLDKNELRKVTLKWVDNSTSETGYIIERSLASNISYVAIDTVNANIVSYSDETVLEATNYIYRIRAYNSTTKNYSEYSNTKTVLTILGAPSNLAGVANQTGGVDLTWKDNSNNEEGFQIEREDPTTRAFVLLTSVGAGIEQYTDATTGEGKLYKYRVRGYNTNVNSPYSNEVSAITIMGAPSQLVAKTLNSSEIELSWLDNSESETGFKIEREKSSNVFDSIGVVGADTKLFVDKQLQENTSYVYRVIAFNQVTKTTYSNLDTALTKLNTPTALDLDKNELRKVTLKWVDNSTSETGYIIERSLASNISYVAIDTVNANIVSYSDETVLEATNYIYRIRAYNSTTKNYSEYSNTKTVLTILGAPSNLAGVANQTGGVDLTWKDNSNNEEGFQIEREDPTTRAFVLLTSVGAGIEQYTDATTGEGKLYKYRVRGYNTNVNSPYSNEVSAITIMGAPSQLVAKTLNSSEIELSWLDNSESETGFKIEREKSSNVFDSIGVVGADTKLFVDKQLQENTSYVYRVIAFNQVTKTTYSNLDTALTKLNTPTALDLDKNELRKVTLKWVDNSTSETGYIIERSLASNISYVAIDTVNANIVSYSDETVLEATNYIYRIRAYNSTTKNYSEYSNTKTVLTILGAPSNLAGVANQTGGVDLTWKDNSNNEEGFQIEREDPTTRAFVLLTSVGAGIEQYTDATTGEGKLYKYRVRGYNSSIFSTYSNIDSATTVMGAPSNLVLSALDYNKIKLNWQDNSQVETGFIIERNLNTTRDFVILDTVVTDIISYIDSTVSEGSSYSYRLKSFNKITSSSFSTNVSTFSLLKNPTNLVSNNSLVNKVSLNWNDNSLLETSIKIEREAGSNNFTEIATLAANTTSYTDTTVLHGEQYKYKVKFYNANTNSNYSNTVIDTAIIATPTNFISNPKLNGTVDLAWNNNSNNTISYSIYRTDSLTSQLVIVDTISTNNSENNVTYNDTTGAEGITYFYKVLGFTSIKSSQFSNLDTAKIVEIASPDKIAAQAGSTGDVKLAWKDNSKIEDGYQIFRQLKSNRSNEFSGSRNGFTIIDTAKANSTEYTDKSVAENTQYEYLIKAFNTQKKIESTEIPEEKPVVKTVPVAAPSLFESIPNPNGGVDLSWIDNSSLEDKFVIEWEDLNTRAFVLLTEINQANSTSYHHNTNIAKRQRYRIKAVDLGTNSESAYIVSNIPVSAPNSLTFNTNIKNSITISWVDNSDNEDGFKIERKSPNSNVFVQIGQVGTNVNSFVDVNVIEVETYVYRVSSFNSLTVSDNSPEFSVTSKLAEPTDLSGKSTSAFRIELSWNDNSSVEEEYSIQRSSSANSGFSEIAVISANSTSFSDINLTPLTKYFYKILARKGPFESFFSNVVEIATGEDPNKNIAPILSDIPNVAFNEDDSTTIDLKLYAKDENTGASSLKFTAEVFSLNGTSIANNTEQLKTAQELPITEISKISNNLTQYSFNSNGNDLIITINETTKVASFKATSDSSGVFKVQFTATDPDGLSDKDSIDVTVNPINDAPTVKVIPELTVNEDDSTTISLATILNYVEDRDNALSEIKIKIGYSKNNLNVISNADTLFKILPVNNWFGTDTLDLVVSDLVASVNSKIIVSVSSVNDLPLFENIPDSLIVDMNSVYTLNIWNFVSDIETNDKDLIFNFTSTEQNISFDLNKDNGELKIISKDNFVGNGNIGIEVIDENNGSANISILIVVESVTGIEDLFGVIPSDYTVEQNYPNPFNPSTIIRYALPVESNVKIAIYNILGEKVVSLLNETKHAGYHEISWNATRNSSGIYILLINGNSMDGSQTFSITKKMILVK